MFYFFMLKCFPVFFTIVNTISFPVSISSWLTASIGKNYFDFIYLITCCLTNFHRFSRYTIIVQSISFFPFYLEDLIFLLHF